MAGDVVSANLVQPQMTDGFDPAVNVTALGNECVHLLPAGGLPLQIGLHVVFQQRGKPDRSKAVLVTFDQELAEFLLGVARRLCGFQRHPFDALAPAVVFDGQTGEKVSVASSEAANRVLAVVADFGVSVAA